ncbi:hypothetical protein AT864_03076 [Anoxybacillus sp. P3H1B]|uniref:helix-turn-helix domain-containing protein n=1 Tax=Anoxybacillus sp. P3H1B TaxID=1769293 RepID=UPI000799EB3C|nr:helix-turn-helix transcriptional regulator [Anoxybacillus sp. P3H1B]KXG08659.1 hypothetical protein AT864_03076 [Anoxybacillus sp. P3H1B]
MIRNKLKKICEERNITIAEGCRLTNLARSVFGRIYRNEVVNINLDTIDAICKGLDIEIHDFLAYVPDDLMTKEDVAHVTEREMAVKATRNMRKRNARKKAKSTEE